MRDLVKEVSEASQKVETLGEKLKRALKGKGKLADQF